MEEMTVDMQGSQIARDSFLQQSEQEPKFPVTELASLDEMINRQRNWTVPVHHKGELEILLDAAIRLCKEGVDRHSEPCQRFFREGLVISFTKIMTDESVCLWKDVTQKGILRNAEKLIELVVSKLSQDCLPLLNLLAIILNPQCKFHCCNARRPSETVPTASTIPDDTLFARPPNPQEPVGWLVDLVNKFGALKGFQILYERFACGSQLSLQVIAALMLPFGQCAEVLTPHTVQNYFIPIVSIVMKIPNDVTDRTMKKESKRKAKNDDLSSIIRSLKLLVCRLPNQEETITNLEIFKQRMISRNMSDQNVKSRHSQGDVAMYLTSDKMGENITMDIPWNQLPSDTPPQQNKRREKRKLAMQISKDQELTFPTALLDTLDEKVRRTRWVIPIFPGEELECLLDAAIRLSKKGVDTRSEPCQRFFREGLTISFTKLMTDDISNWKEKTFKCILKNTELLIELVVAKLSQDCFPLLGLLAMVFNPQCKFHSCSARRLSETVPVDSDLPDDALFARPPNLREPRGWLVDLVNRFGALDGFQILYERFANGPLSIPVIDALIRPFGQCTDVLTPYTVQTYFMPVMNIVLKFLDGVTVEELKKESKPDSMSEVVTFIFNALKKLISRLPNQAETVKKLEIFRQQITLRLFNSKTNTGNELHKEIVSVPRVLISHHSQDEDKKFTCNKVEGKMKDKPLSTPNEQTKCIGLNHNRTPHSPQFTTVSEFTVESKKENPDILASLSYLQALKNNTFGVQQETQLSPKDKVHDTSCLSLQKLPGHAGDMKADIDQTEAVFVHKQLVQRAESVGLIRSPSACGTGFHVGPGYIMKAKHVVDQILKGAPVPLQQQMQISPYHQLSNISVFIDFSYERSHLPSDDNLRFHFEPVILYANDYLDTVILKLKPNTEKVYPPALTKFAHLCNDECFGYFIGHSKADIKKTDKYQCVKFAPHEITAAKEWSVKHVNVDGFVGIDDPKRVLLHCSFEKGASGAPGFCINPYDGEAHVVLMLLRGYPDWYYDDKYKQETKIGIPPKCLIEQGVSMASIYEDMKTKAPTLSKEIFEHRCG